MARNNPQIIFLYLLLPAISIIFIYSFIFAKFSTVNQPYGRYQNYFFPGANTWLNRNHTIVVNSVDTTTKISVTSNYHQRKDENFIKINANEQFVQFKSWNQTQLWNKSMEQRYQKEKLKFPLKVIIVPHSHNDPGWLNTYDQYFYHYTYYVLENLVKNLNKYPNMTFIWSEMSFFSRWWESLNSDKKMKENLKKLIENKRLEIVTGGWVMTDEGPAHYYDVIDQLIEGHQFLRTALKFKLAPRNSWSIDPFGHSTTLAYLLKKAGISNMYIQRTHYAWKQFLSQHRYLEFFWKQPFEEIYDRGPLCHMSPLQLYSFKYACGPDYKVCLEFDFRKIYGETSESTATALNQTNIDLKAHKILKQYSRLGSLFPHNVALVLLGDDFRYNFDIEWQQQYSNYMLLMDYVNSNPNKFDHSEVMFGTLEDYFDAIDQRIPIEKRNYPLLEGDFIPYADAYVEPVASYWTGYFTTRPYFKLFSRELQHWLRSTEIVYALVRNYIRQQRKSHHLDLLLDQEYSVLSNARQNLALFQHHDGITGTSKSYVMEDYGRRLSHSLTSTMQMFAKMVQYLNLDSDTMDNVNNTQQFIFPILFKPHWNSITEQQVLRVPADADGLRLLVSNSHTQMRIESIKILADDPFIQIFDIENNQKIPYQINPIFKESKLSSSVFEIEFFDKLYPLSLKNYKLLTSDESIHSKVTIFKQDLNRFAHSNEVFLFEKPKSFHLENDLFIIYLNQRGFIEKIHFKRNNLTKYFDMSFVSYNSRPKKSGAYLQKFIHQNPYPDLFFSSTPTINMFKGQLSSTIIVNYTDIIYSIKLHNIKSNIGAAIELKVLIDLENKPKYDNQEVAIRLKTHINNRKKSSSSSNETLRTFYVDSNGFQILERQFIEAIGIEGNYYPMTSSFFIEDHDWRFTVLSSHSHGATSSQDGMVEIMLDRRIVIDDKRGLSEGITDNLPVQSSFWMVFEEFPSIRLAKLSSLPTLSKLADSLLLYLHYPSIVLYSYRSDQEITQSELKDFYRNRYMIAPNTKLCQYFFMNLRTLPNNENFNYPSKSSLMLLHNRATIPMNNWIDNFDHQCLEDLNNNFSMPIVHMFNDLRVESIEKTSLTGMEMNLINNSKDQTLSSSSSSPFLDQLLSIPAFQIESFNITFY